MNDAGCEHEWWALHRLVPGTERLEKPGEIVTQSMDVETYAKQCSICKTIVKFDKPVPKGTLPEDLSYHERATMTPTEILLHKITDRTMKRMDVVKSYALAPKDLVDWVVIDQAITDRWSENALYWIRNEVKHRFSSKRAREGLSKNRIQPLWKCSCTWWNGSNHKVCQKCDEEKPNTN